MTISPLKDVHLKDVLQLSNEAFGVGYLSIDYLKSHLNSEKHIAFVVTTENSIAGFTLIDILTPNELKNYVLKGNNWFYNYFKEFNQIVIRKQTIVSKNHQNQGIGSFLIKESIVAFKNDIILSLVWDKREKTYLRNILLRNNFSEIKTIYNYWGIDSVTKNYSCPQCGIPPCKCNVLVFMCRPEIG